jgi:hypothetical protein
MYQDATTETLEQLRKLKVANLVRMHERMVKYMQDKPHMAESILQLHLHGLAAKNAEIVEVDEEILSRV